MSFIIDKQTIADLNLLGKYDSKSIYHLYDRALTRGGRRLMEQMFHHPLTSASEINERAALFAAFMQHPIDFPFTIEEVNKVEHYISTPADHSLFAHNLRFMRSKAMLYIAGNRALEGLEEGVRTLIALLARLAQFTKKQAEVVEQYAPVAQEIESLVARLDLAMLQKQLTAPRLSLRTLMHLHRWLRITHHQETSRLIEHLYHLDLQISVAKVAVDNRFHTAQAYEPSSDEAFVRAHTLFHPTVQGAKGNSFEVDSVRNMIFLTGANMAGKSTFMKSVGIAIYLAHMGFPVPATELHFTVCDGLYSSINVSDNITLGHSHYYAEVQRVKRVAESVAAGHRLFVILDELFKGTNVKDALDATAAVLRGFATHPSSLYIVSTHILEAAEELKDLPQLRYHYFPTTLVGGVPRYTYQLTEGITNDRHGMKIILNEGIIDRIRSAR